MPVLMSCSLHLVSSTRFKQCKVEGLHIPQCNFLILNITSDPPPPLPFTPASSDLKTNIADLIVLGWAGLGWAGLRVFKLVS